MHEEGELIDLRAGRHVDVGAEGRRTDGQQLADNDTIEVLAHALSQPPARQRAAVLPHDGPATVVGPPLKRIDALPRLMRRRIDVYLGEGEDIECAVLAARGTVPRWALVTTHRVIIEGNGDTPGSGSMSLPYHRTEAWVDSGGSVRLRSQEFDRVRNTSLQPDSAYAAETTHLLARLTAG